MYSPELASKIALWQQKSAQGTMTQEEYREAIAALRQGRLAAASQSAAKKSKPSAKKSGDDLLEEFL